MMMMMTMKERPTGKSSQTSIGAAFIPRLVLQV